MIAYLRRRAMMKGVFGGGRAWTTVWAVLLAGRLLKRLLRKEPEIVWRGELAPGETLVVTDRDREPRVLGA